MDKLNVANEYELVHCEPSRGDEMRRIGTDHVIIHIHSGPWRTLTLKNY